MRAAIVIPFERDRLRYNGMGLRRQSAAPYCGPFQGQAIVEAVWPAQGICLKHRQFDSSTSSNMIKVETRRKTRICRLVRSGFGKAQFSRSRKVIDEFLSQSPALVKVKAIDYNLVAWCVS